ncbi:hypothetical protein M408DRAFT_30300 [Serendipita vermifera MAFF 305830]|uniref:Uncharacterized protein n=1 Tax=Serendipita vermifera MAFF 305830 TaxID=933852 RepID=A0A0C2WSI9_SERVB|nr:hypothetical protein M408DRAFT_30300 [Serendipita vermifera MAFF 305830]
MRLAIQVVLPCINNVISSYVKGVIPRDKGDDGPDMVCEPDPIAPFDIQW